jgi:hypothetical protein
MSETYRDPFDDEDDDDDEELEEFDDGDREADEGEQDATFFNEITGKQIVHELVVLSNRELLEFLDWEFDRLGFTERTELALIGIDFDTCYILEFYNVREDKTVKTSTGAGNMFMLINGWVTKTLVEMMVERLYGDLADIWPSDLTDCYLNILMDVLDWKTETGLETIDSQSPEDGPLEDSGSARSES